MWNYKWTVCDIDEQSSSCYFFVKMCVDATHWKVDKDIPFSSSVRRFPSVQTSQFRFSVQNAFAIDQLIKQTATTITTTTYGDLSPSTAKKNASNNNNNIMSKNNRN